MHLLTMQDKTMHRDAKHCQSNAMKNQEEHRTAKKNIHEISRYTKGGGNLQVRNSSRKELEYYGDMVNYGYFDMGINGEVNEDKDHLAIEELQHNYRTKI